MKDKYNVKHIRCSMEDFNYDRHRFSFIYNNKRYEVSCYHSFNIFFENEKEIPENVRLSISLIICDKIDKNEMKWAYPDKAYEVADRYCKENFA